MFFNFAEVMCELKETASRPSTQADSRKSTFLFPVITELYKIRAKSHKKLTLLDFGRLHTKTELCKHCRCPNQSASFLVQSTSLRWEFLLCFSTHQFNFLDLMFAIGILYSDVSRQLTVFRSTAETRLGAFLVSIFGFYRQFGVQKLPKSSVLHFPWIPNYTANLPVMNIMGWWH